MLSFQIVAKSSPDKLLDVVEKVDKNTVYNILQIAVETGIDVEVNAVETHEDSQKVKLVKVLDTSVYRKLGIIKSI